MNEGTGPVTVATEGERWTAHPVAARAIRIVALVLPVATALAVTWVAVWLLPTPSTLSQALATWTGAAVLAFVLVRVLDPLARRLLPLASALRLSLSFPEHAPSRLRRMLARTTEEELDRLLRRAKWRGLSADPQVAVDEILTLSARLDVHDKVTRGHAERVRAYTRLIAAEMGLSRDELDRLQWVGLLHDIGKLAIPCEILNKAGDLNAAEWTIVRTHPEVGARMVEPLRPWLGDLIDGVGQHHERWDGAGYPSRLSGEDISLAARIVAVADVYDVITATRSYTEARPSSEALREIADCAGTQFDERVVRALLAIPTRRLRTVAGPMAVLAEIPLLGPLLTNLPGSVAGLAGGLSQAAGAAVTAATVGGMSLVAVPAAPVVPSTDGQASEVVIAAAPVDRDANSSTAGDSTSFDGSTLVVVDPADVGDPVDPDPGGDGAGDSPDPRPGTVVLVDDVLDTRRHTNVLVTSNDTGVDATTVTVVSTRNAERVTVKVTDEGEAMLQYHALKGYTGLDEVVYRGCDATGERCATATVLVTVANPSGGGDETTTGGQATEDGGSGGTGAARGSDTGNGGTGNTDARSPDT